jgi:lysophospholipase L1-like esterase
VNPSGQKSKIPQIDDTLTQPGYAADAAKVGKQLTDLSKEIADLVGGTVLTEVPITENDIVPGTMIYGKNGEELKTSTWNCTTFLPANFEANSEVTIRCTVFGNGGFAFYDANKQFILGVYAQNCADYGITADGKVQTMKLAVPENTEYVRMSYQTSWQETYADLVLSGYKISNIETKISNLEEKISEKVHLPKDADGNLMYGVFGGLAMSDGKGGIIWEEFTDEELLTKGYTIQESDITRGAAWAMSATDAPVAIANRSAIRKFKTTKMFSLVPDVSINGTFTFWKNGIACGEINYIDIKDSWAVDFDFDEVAFTITYRAEYSADRLNIQVKYPEVNNIGKVLVLGDSISTDYYGNYTKWVTMLMDDGYLPKDTTNDSIHATGFVARYNGETNDFVTRIQAVADKETYDLVIVFGGINDFIQSVPMGGGDGETDTTTYFKPAVDYFFEYLVNNFTQARIVVLSPLRTYNPYPNQVSVKQEEYTAYIREVAKSYCLPVLNLSEESGFIPFNDVFKNRWTFTGWTGEDGTKGDGVHPSEEYMRKFLAPMIKGFLMSIKPNQQ